MGRIYETQNSAHASAVARALLEAGQATGDEDRAGQITTTTGQNGRVAFSVPDDYPDVSVPEPGTESDEAASGGALHPGVDRVIGDTDPNALEPQEEQEPEQQTRRRGRRATQEQEQEQQTSGEQSSS